MSGGGKGGRGPKNNRPVEINVAGLKTGLREAAPANRGGIGRSSAAGESKRAAGVARAIVPAPQGPTGIDTSGSGLDAGDPQSILARTQAALRRRKAQARGGGLSNVALGGETLG